MRVQVTRPRSRAQRGAIALLAAALSVVVVTVAAFAVDFGMAYTSKRQLQTAADAGALAAASYYTQQLGNCSTLIGNASYKTAAQAIATDYVTNNRPSAERVGRRVGSVEW